MTGLANVARGEAEIAVNGRAMLVRPSFAALVATESEVGSLLALVERAAEGRLTLAEIEALVWHCLADRPDDMPRADLGEALVTQGIGTALPALRMILRQALAAGQ
ncbi:gene transfer agent family protein [Sphingobium nicotianae]|uniref:Gene transfer agent family protein n=1 Tax=Sphingobium nicotianae TaxID=2782607 RepID=A0A9X1DBF5_9SPHN|nr:gene transfer agent family protein [Sphingobium nicotianae]